MIKRGFKNSENLMLVEQKNLKKKKIVRKII